MTLTEELTERGLSAEEIGLLLSTRIVVAETASSGVKIPLIAADGSAFFAGLEPSTDPADLERLYREAPGGGFVVLRPAIIFDTPDSSRNPTGTEAQ